MPHYISLCHADVLDLHFFVWERGLIQSSHVFNTELIKD